MKTSQINKVKYSLTKLISYNNIIKINIFHNNTCYVDRHFPIQLKKPLQMAM